MDPRVCPVLAYAAWTRGEHAEARALISESVVINHTFHDLVGLVLAIELLALVTVGEGDPSEAAVLQGGAEPVWDSVGLPLFGSSHFSSARAACERQAGRLLGAERYAERVREGRGMDLEALVRRALRVEGPFSAAPLEVAHGGRRGPAPETRKPAGSPSAQGGGETAG